MSDRLYVTKHNMNKTLKQGSLVRYIFIGSGGCVTIKAQLPWSHTTWVFLCLCTGDSCGRRHCVFSLSVRSSSGHNISRSPWGTFFKVGTIVYLDSRMNRLDFRGEKSISLWIPTPVNTFFNFGRNVYCSSSSPIDNNWVSKGPGQCDLTKHIFGGGIQQRCVYSSHVLLWWETPSWQKL